MHGFNQGFAAIKELIELSSPDIFMLQEHWLTPANIVKFNEMFPTYLGFGASALSHKVECGPLVGRPFGGVFTLIKSSLLSVTRCIHVAERFVIVLVGDVLLINVYLPCVGTVDRDIITNDMLLEICTFKEQYDNCGCLLAGDFNTDLDKNTNVSKDINHYLMDNNFSRCDMLNPSSIPYTYANDSLSHYSRLDYIVYDNVTVHNYDVIDSGSNLSDHLPITAHFDRCFAGSTFSDSSTVGSC